MILEFGRVKLRRKEHPEEEFQMAPMIDMVFLLLVFFMTVSTLAHDERRPLELAESDRAQVPEEVMNRGTVSLEFVEPEVIQLFLGATPVSEEELRTALTAGLRADPELEINLRAPHDMPFREVRKVLKLCAGVGAYKIVYATYQKS